MHSIRAWARLSGTQKRLTLQAGLTLLATHARMAWVPRWSMRAALAGARIRRHRSLDADSASTIASAIDRVAPHIPIESTCLARALAARTLLARYGYPSELVVGVGFNPHAPPSFHAWLIAQGNIVVGARDDLSRFQSLIHSV